ncbi:MAG: cellulase family glycosylhydrolase [Chloroflexi bacterium]|nr:cellulase family glycosylhydrolase [Chloroflexota bacterium]
MRKRQAALSLIVLAGLLLAPLLALLPAQPAAAATGFVTRAFEDKWNRTDLPVDKEGATRSWVWGTPLNARTEPYVQSPGRQRQVQYFDKSRMEINDPATNAVTNGLLATELIRGRLQYGDLYDAEGEERGPARVNVAGDDDDTSGPQYASFTSHLREAPLPEGAPVTQTMDRNGVVGDDPSKAARGVTAGVLVRETNSRVASVFWDYLQTTGPVAVGNARPTERIFEPWFDATGFPTTRPYWARVKVANQVQDVLIQAFERRVLTYTPDNSNPAFRVEMGNIGRHYFTWRYGQQPTPATGSTPQPSDWQPRVGPTIAPGFNGFFQFTPLTDPANVQTLQRSLNLVKDAGFDWIRVQVVWADLEPNEGQPLNGDILSALDATVHEARLRRFGVMFSIAKGPRWAVDSDNGCQRSGAGLPHCGLPTSRPATLASILGRLAERYKQGSERGRVHAYEVWNEQNLGHETANNVNPGAYVEILKASYNAIKAADSTAIVVFGGLSPTGVNNPAEAVDDVKYLEQAYQYNNGEMKRYFDVLGAHPGSNNNPPDARWPSDNLDEARRICAQQSRQWCDHPSFYFRRIEQLRAVMERNGDGQYGNRLKQMWLTEFGWSTLNRAPGYGYGAQITEQQQADYLVRAFEQAQREYKWMGVMFVWTLNHSIVPDVGCDNEKYPWSVIHGGKCPEEQAAGKQAWDPRPSYLALKAKFNP